MDKSTATDMARQLLSALYVNPHHGPIVTSRLPKSEMMPGPEMCLLYGYYLDHGLGKGDLDYARLDRDARKVDGFDEISSADSYMLNDMRFKGSADMLVMWADELANRHSNVSFARDLRVLAKALPDSDVSTQEAVARVIDRAKGYIERQQIIEHISEGVDRALLRVEQWKEGNTSDYLLTGWGSVDQALGGWPIGEMSVMAGMTSGFKTASLVDMTRRMGMRFEQASEPGAIVGFSAEMSHEKMCHRLAANISGVPSARMRPNRFGHRDATDDEERQYQEALVRARDWHIFINEVPNPTYQQMYSQCLQVQAQMPLGLVWFDYIEKMEEDAPSEELRVSKIAQNLKALAKRLEVPVITLSQYSRAAESSNGDIPKNYWLRYSGKIEQEANTIIHWHYPKYFIDRKYNPSNVENWDPSHEHAIYAVCGKNRGGQVRDVMLEVEPTTGQFIDSMDNRYG